MSPSSGPALTRSTTVEFPCEGDTTLLAAYERIGAPRDYYVNDDTPEEGFAAGSDDDDVCACNVCIVE